MFVRTFFVCFYVKNALVTFVQAFLDTACYSVTLNCITQENARRHCLQEAEEAKLRSVFYR
jgi:hypothetical protein